MSSDLTLSPPRIKLHPDRPFEGDLFDRKQLATKLNGYIDRLSDGSVIAIDAPWGEGKTWFGKNWASSLTAEGYPVIYLDAFQQDYVADPFLLIVSEIAQLIASDDSLKENFTQKAAGVMKSIIPVGSKILLNFAGRVIAGTSSVSDDIESAINSAVESSAEVTQKLLEDKISAYNKDKESLYVFKDSLTEFCSSQSKPVVFFIDELDRCKPTFAVNLIERLKHFFDVPNLVFVLLLNREQIENAIKGVYGHDTDASSYLGKFIHLFFRLPKLMDSGYRRDANYVYLVSLSKHYKFDSAGADYLNTFIRTFSTLGTYTGMSLRDMEKAMALLAIAGIDNQAVYLSWLIFLKLKKPQIFNGLLISEIGAHKEAKTFLNNLNDPENKLEWMKTYFDALHSVFIDGEDSISDKQKQAIENGKPSGFFRTNIPLDFWLRKLDIGIQD
jgi:hypothetical protein